MLVAGRSGLRHVVGIANIKNIVEQMQDSEFARDALGMPARSVGEDQLASGQTLNARRQFRVRGKPGKVKIVDVVEKQLGVHVMHLHQTTQGGAELPIVSLLQVPRILEGNAEKAGNEFAHALVDLTEQIALDRIERVIEIEDP